MDNSTGPETSCFGIVVKSEVDIDGKHCNMMGKHMKQLGSLFAVKLESYVNEQVDGGALKVTDNVSPVECVKNEEIGIKVELDDLSHGLSTDDSLTSTDYDGDFGKQAQMENSEQPYKGLKRSSSSSGPTCNKKPATCELNGRNNDSDIGEDSATKECYKFCFVPLCQNTTKTAPGKWFFGVPDKPDVRATWITAAEGGDRLKKKGGYCCEDHFNVEKDMENYWQCKLMGSSYKLKRLRCGVIPHKFECQGRINERQEEQTQQKTIEEAFQNRQIQGNFRNLSPENVSTGVFHEDTDMSMLTPSFSSVGTQVTLRSMIRYRSKAIQTLYKMFTKDATTSTIQKSFATVSTSTSAREMFQIVLQDMVTVENGDDGESLEGDKVTGRDGDCEHLKDTNYVPDTESDSESLEDDVKTKQDSDDCESLEGESDVGESDVAGRAGKVNLQKDAFLRYKINLCLEKSKLYVGIPTECSKIISLLEDTCSCTVRDIMLCLRKIRLNESFEILGDVFGYTKRQASGTFLKNIPVIAASMKSLISWPKKEAILRNLPVAFKNKFQHVESIIQWFEIQFQEPSDPLNQQSWSDDKKTSTIKYLISITPDGLINFISQGFASQSRDTIILKQSNFLQHINNNTWVLADIGFENIEKLVQDRGGKVITPQCFDMNKEPTRTSRSVENLKQSSDLRMPMKKCVRKLREFKFIAPHACINRNMVRLTDSVIKICCAIINLQDKYIKTYGKFIRRGPRSELNAQ